MLMLTKEIEARLPELYSQEKVEDPIVKVKVLHRGRIGHGMASSLTRLTGSSSAMSRDSRMSWGISHSRKWKV